MENKKKYVWHSDPGHAWLEVERRELEELGISDKISAYSYSDYFNGTKVYLEADCDAEIFIEAKKVRGEEIEFEERYSENTFIRKLNSFRELNYRKRVLR